MIAAGHAAVIREALEGRPKAALDDDRVIHTQITIDALAHLDALVADHERLTRENEALRGIVKSADLLGSLAAIALQEADHVGEATGSEGAAMRDHAAEIKEALESKAGSVNVGPGPSYVNTFVLRDEVRLPALEHLDAFVADHERQRLDAKTTVKWRNHYREEVDRLAREVEALREALGFYGDKESYRAQVGARLPITVDRGKRARAVLAPAGPGAGEPK